MTTGELITGIVMFVIACVLFFFSVRHFLERGFLFNNAYLYASKQERLTMDKKPYYRQSAIVLCLLGFVFATIGLSVILHSDWLLIPEAALIAAALIYAIVSSAKMSRR